MSNTDPFSNDSHESKPPARKQPGPNVLIVLRDFGMGGAQRQAALVANGLHARSAAAVQVWAFEPGQALGKMLAPGISTRIIHPGSERNPLHRAWALVRFIRAVRTAQPEVILPFTDFPNRVLGAVWRLTGAGACVWNQRDEGREVTGRPFERRAVRQSTWFIANSAVGKEHLVNTFGVPSARISIIRNGVVIPTAAADREVSRHDLGIDNDTLVAAMVANLHRFKDHETLVQAWRLVVEAVPSRPLLLLAGRPGNTHAQITRLRSRLGLEQSIRLLGEVDNVGNVLSAADLAVFSSRREGCPNAVLEAMAAGLPVVATDIVGTREALGRAYPYLVPQSDPQSLADALRELLMNPAKCADLGERNRDRVTRKFDPGSTVDAYADLISRLLKTSRDGRLVNRAK